MFRILGCWDSMTFNRSPHRSQMQAAEKITAVERRCEAQMFSYKDTIKMFCHRYTEMQDRYPSPCKNQIM